MDFNNNSDRVTNFQIVLFPTSNQYSMADIESASKIARYLECEALVRRAENAEKFKKEEWKRSKQRVFEEKSKLEQMKNMLAAPSMSSPRPTSSTTSTSGTSSGSQHVTSTGELLCALHKSDSNRSTIYPPPKKMKLCTDTRNTAKQAPSVGISSRDREPVDTPPIRKIQVTKECTQTSTSLNGNSSVVPSTLQKNKSSKSKKSTKQIQPVARDTHDNAKKNPARLTHHPTVQAKKQRKKTALSTSTPKRVKRSKKSENITNTSPVQSLFQTSTDKPQNTDGKINGPHQMCAQTSLTLDDTLILAVEEPEVPLKNNPEVNLDSIDMVVVNAPYTSIHDALTETAQEVAEALSAQEKIIPTDKRSITQDIIKTVTSLQETIVEKRPTNMLTIDSAIKQKRNPHRIRVAPYTLNRSSWVNALNKNGTSEVMDKRPDNTNKSAIQKAQSSTARRELCFADNSSTYAQTTRPTLPVSIKATTESIRALIREKSKEATSATESLRSSPHNLKTNDKFPLQLKRPEVSFPRNLEGTKTSPSMRISVEDPNKKVTPLLRKQSLSLCRPKENIVTDSELMKILNKPDEVLLPMSTTKSLGGTFNNEKAEDTNLQNDSTSTDNDTPMTSGHSDHNNDCNGIMPTKTLDRVGLSAKESMHTSMFIKESLSPETANSAPQQVQNSAISMKKEVSSPGVTDTVVSKQDQNSMTIKKEIPSPDAIRMVPRKILNPAILDETILPEIDIEKVLDMLYGPNKKKMSQKVIDLIVAKKHN